MSRSTQTTVVKLFEDITRVMGQWYAILLFLFDFNKAFHTVSHWSQTDRNRTKSMLDRKIVKINFWQRLLVVNYMDFDLDRW